MLVFAHWPRGLFLLLAVGGGLSLNGCSPRHPSEVPKTRASDSTPHASASASKIAKPKPKPSLPPVVKALKRPNGAIGERRAVVVDAAAPNGSWVVYCQPMSGGVDGSKPASMTLDSYGRFERRRLLTYLAVSENQPRVIDRLIDYDPSGRYLVLKERDSVWLEDTLNDERLNLSERGLDARQDVRSYIAHRSLSFDSAGSHLAYLKRTSNKYEFALLALGNGSALLDAPEQSLSVDEAEVWRLSLSPRADWLIADVVPEDSTGNGRLDWPLAAAKQEAPPCPRSITHIETHPRSGDRSVSKLFAVDKHRAPKLEPEFVAPFGHSLLLRDSKGRLLLQTQAEQTELIDGKCNAQVIHADPERGLLIVGCEGQQRGVRWPLHLVGKGFRKALDLELAPIVPDRFPGAAPRLVALHAHQATALVDLDRRTVLQMQAGDIILATLSNTALLRRGNDLWTYNADSGAEKLLVREINPLPQVLVQKSKVLVTPYVVDLAQQRVIGRVTKHAFALALDGSVLTAHTEDPSAGALAVGPLQWVTPEPVATSPRLRTDDQASEEPLLHGQEEIDQG